MDDVEKEHWRWLAEQERGTRYEELRLRNAPWFDEWCGVPIRSFPRETPSNDALVMSMMFNAQKANDSGLLLA